MALVTCGFCGHPGSRAAILPPSGGTGRCSGCPDCACEAREEELQSAPVPNEITDEERADAT